VPLHRLYGLTVDSEFPLPAPLAEGDRADVTVRWGAERDVPVDPPPGEVLCRVDLAVVKYSKTRTADGYLLRYPGICDALVDESLTNVDLAPQSFDASPLIELLFAGSILATLVILGGGCTLHASAVATNGRAFAFIGPSGRGKSTLAALSCAVGGRLITDDVLRVVRGDDGFLCPTGTGIVRLRPQAESIASLLSGTVLETYDGRVGVGLGVSGEEWPVAALVFPRPSKTSSTVGVMRLSEHDALMRLTSTRLHGWTAPKVLTDGFRWNASLARELPSYEVEVPWGPPFDLSIISALLQILDERSKSPE
jgi:hypothetical protein